MADAKRLFDLNRQAGKQIAERVLKRETDHDRTDRRGREDSFLQDHRGAQREQPDDDRVLHDGRKAIRQTIDAPRIDDEGDQTR